MESIEDCFFQRNPSTHFEGFSREIFDIHGRTSERIFENNFEGVCRPFSKEIVSGILNF